MSQARLCLFAQQRDLTVSGGCFTDSHARSLLKSNKTRVAFTSEPSRLVPSVSTDSKQIGIKRKRSRQCPRRMCSRRSRQPQRCRRRAGASAAAQAPPLPRAAAARGTCAHTTHRLQQQRARRRATTRCVQHASATRIDMYMCMLTWYTRYPRTHLST